jgi:hypothetical protein
MDDVTTIPMAEQVIEDELPPIQGHACESCGAPVDTLDKFCNACGSSQNLDVPVAHVVEEQQKHFRCKNCGSEVATDPDQRSYVCAFCDSTYVIELSAEESHRQRPEFVIGFAVTQEQANEKFRAWIRQSRWFRPGDLASAKIEKRLRGVYLPFWSFSTLAESDWSARIGEYWYRTETYTTTDSKGNTVARTRRVRETEWWGLSGEHHRYYSQHLVSGSRGLSQADADRINPYRLEALKRYEPYFLAGWLAEEYSVERDDALDHSNQEFHRREQNNCAEFLPGDTHQDLRVSTQFRKINSDLILLPVYLLSYRYGDKLYRFLINGQTGRVVGDKPLSWKRIGGAIGAGVAAVVLLLVTLFLLGVFGR